MFRKLLPDLMIRQDPNAPEIIRGIHTVAEAAFIIGQHHQLSNELDVRYWNIEDLAGEEPGTGIFAYYFFDVRGEYCGLYMPDRHSVHLLMTPMHYERALCTKHRCRLHSDGTVRAIH